MIQGKYIGPDNLLSLKREETYYLFPHGHSHFYVSRFPNQGAHTGCFERTLFSINTETTSYLTGEPERIPFSLDCTKIYKAKLVWRPVGYKSTALKTYYVSPKKTHGYFFEDAALTKCRGSFPLHWFEDFKEVTNIIEETEKKEEKFSLKKDIETVNELQEYETESENVLAFEQLSLFD
jgi:hypothetical protein